VADGLARAFRPVRLMRGREAFVAELSMPADAVGMLLVARDPADREGETGFALQCVTDGLGLLLVDSPDRALSANLPGFDAVGAWAGRLIEAACWAARHPTSQSRPVALLGTRVGGAAVIEAAAALGETARALVLVEARLDMASRVARALVASPTLALWTGREVEPVALQVQDWLRKHRVC
jgi:hypothetical protein